MIARESSVVPAAGAPADSCHTDPGDESILDLCQLLPCPVAGAENRDISIKAKTVLGASCKSRQVSDASAEALNRSIGIGCEDELGPAAVDG